MTRAPTAIAMLATMAVLMGCDDTGAQGLTSTPGTSTSTSTTPSRSAPSTDAASPRPTRLARPRTPVQALHQIVAAETAVLGRDTSRAELRRAGRQQQLTYRTISRHPGWDTTIRRGLPRRLRLIVHDSVAARRAFRAIPGSVLSTVPAWEVRRPLPMRVLLGLYHHAAAATGVSWAVLAAVNLVESDLGRIHGLSTAGAQGPMQFEPGTWAAYGAGGDIDDPADAIAAAARLLAANGGDRPDGIARALLHYNPSTAYVRGVLLVAGVLRRHPAEFGGYYQWRVYYRTTAGDVVLPVGYYARRPVPVRRWLARHPQP